MFQSKKVLILGLGMQGQAALYDIMNTTDVGSVIATDAQYSGKQIVESYASERLSFQQIDADNRDQLQRLMATSDIVIEALPAELVCRVARIAAEQGVHLVSSMYFTNQSLVDPYEIKAQETEVRDIGKIARTNSCTLISELGMDPGLDIILGKANIDEFDEVHEFDSYGAGFPSVEASNNPLKYKFTWSIYGVMLSYFRAARFIVDGEVQETQRDAMFAQENMHTIEDPAIDGIVECFPNGDSVKYAEKFGVRHSIKKMGRYICRRPGHSQFWDVVAKCGLLDPKPIKLGRQDISPAEYLAKVLQSQPQFFYEKDEQDIAFIRTDVRGVINGQRKRIIYQIIDRRDLSTGFTAMQRTVGFTLSIGAQLIMAGKFPEPGLRDAMEVPFSWIRPELEKRGIWVTRKECSWK